MEDIAVASIAIDRTGPAALEAVAPATGSSDGDTTTTIAHLSPSLQLNAEIGIVVIQFRDQSGAVELSIPNQQQLDAYAADPFSANQSHSSTTA
jgi:hypothetical protein